MLNIRIGNLLDVESGVIVHGCNMQGVMGSGVALAIKTKYPKAYEDYKRYCPNAKLGDVIYSEISKEPRLRIANALTQQNYGRDGQRFVSYQAIQYAFSSVCEMAQSHNLEIHFPLIGAGLGGGDWSIISNIIENQIVKYDIAHTLWIID